eukprot:TRINITY_DN1468_c0_g2_i2.p2 TRINITY_DN1468_c0_g2~~TRINITY_DN1468_c0_g2_i2.p2  ORF type:complete len:117 (+),score=23.48 TRINITY_DN1468_c0_g2_i2:400-750(+)
MPLRTSCCLFCVIDRTFLVGLHYFDCKENHGVFSPIQQVELLVCDRMPECCLFVIESTSHRKVMMHCQIRVTKKKKKKKENLRHLRKKTKAKARKKRTKMKIKKKTSLLVNQQVKG